jgi:uncharacterized protein (DUF1330 family)
MSEAYVIGQILVKDSAKWDEYRSRVPQTLESWGAELVFRGTQSPVVASDCTHPDVVVIRFPTMEAAQGWLSSADYQLLIPIRLQAADVKLIFYVT